MPTTSARRFAKLPCTGGGGFTTLLDEEFARGELLLPGGRTGDELAALLELTGALDRPALLDDRLAEELTSEPEVDDATCLANRSTSSASPAR